MTDTEWLDAIEKYAITYGCYVFSREERKRLGPFIQHRAVLDWLVANHFHTRPVQVNLILLHDIVTAAREGIVRQVTKKLTQ